MAFLFLEALPGEPKFRRAAKWNWQEAIMSVLAILIISSFFVLAAMVGLADAFVHFVCWGANRLTASKTPSEPAHSPAHGITA
jgi:hypothetical protein